MLISLKANKQSCGPPVASKMHSHLVMFISLKANKQSCGPPAASKTRCVLSNRLGISPYPTAIQKRPLKKGPFLYGGGIVRHTLAWFLALRSNNALY